MCSLPLFAWASFVTSHVRLIQHANTYGDRSENSIRETELLTGDHWIVRDTNATDIVISCSSDLSGTSSPVTSWQLRTSVEKKYVLPIEPIVRITWIGIAIITAKIIARGGILESSLVLHGSTSITLINVRSCASDRDVCNQRHRPWWLWWHFYQYNQVPMLLPRSDRVAACHLLGRHFSREEFITSTRTGSTRIFLTRYHWYRK